VLGLVVEKTLDFVVLWEIDGGNCSQNFQKISCRWKDFSWHASRNLHTFDIGEIQEGKLQNRQDGFQWPLVFVHGTTQQ